MSRDFMDVLIEIILSDLTKPHIYNSPEERIKLSDQILGITQMSATYAQRSYSCDPMHDQVTYQDILVCSWSSPNYASITFKNSAPSGHV